MLLSAEAMRVAQRVAGVIPLGVARPALNVATRAFAKTHPDDEVVVMRNMRRVLGDDVDEAVLRDTTREVFASYGRYWLDAMRLPSLSIEEIDRGFTYNDLHHVTDALAAGTAPILALPHIGGWEWAGAWLSQVRGSQVAAVAERLEPPAMYEWFVEYRRQLGMDIVALGPDAGNEIAAKLAAGAVICLLCDRDLSGDGIEVDFFGERTRLPGGPAVLALRTGSPLLPAAIYFDEDRCHAEVLAPLDTERRGRIREDVRRVTQDLAHALESLIERAPEQWHLLQPNWPSDYVALGREVPPGLEGL